MHSTRSYATVIVALLLAVSVSFGGGKAPLSYPTPEAAVRTAQAAHARSDYPALFACYSEKGLQANINFVMMLMVAREMPPMEMTVTLKVGDQTSTTQATGKPVESTSRPAPSPEQQKRREAFDALLAKHGLTDRDRRPDEPSEAYHARLGSQIKDKRAFLLDVAQFNAVPPKKHAEPMQLVDVKITAKTATGRLERKEGTGKISADISFDRVEGSWLISSILIF